MRALEFVTRLAGALLGCFILANAIGERLHPGYGADWIWIDLSWLPDRVAAVARLALAAVLIVLAFRPGLFPQARWGSTAVLAFFAGACAVDALRFVGLAQVGRIQSPLRISLSLFLSVLFLAQAAFLGAPRPSGLTCFLFRRSWRAGLWWIAAGAVVLALPLAHILTFGQTDYRRRADCAIVLGAQVYEDGKLSDALRDRLATAVELYEEGRVEYLVMTGGTGASGHNEALVMRNWAAGRGVPPERILVDTEGTNSAASVRNTERILRERGFRSALVVSHHFHLPRLKLAYVRAGVRVYTVPAREGSPLRRTPYYVLRECAAFYVYYLRG
ncbi:MAG: YdcF family protein [Planctomycetes bacterium]|nr:YdcF family protein [Planctomycetota bacterium]